MQRYFVKNIKNQKVEFEESDIHHIKNVMRMQKGEKIECVYDRNLYKAEIEKIVNEAKESQESRNNPQVEQTPNSYGNVEPRFKVVPKPTARTEKTGEVTQVKQTPSSSSTVKKTSSSPYMTEYEKRKKEIDEGIKNGTYHVTQVQGNARTNKTSGQSKKPSYLAQW